MRLLLVENDRSIADLVKTRLNVDGFKVDVAGTSGEAQSAVRASNYEAVVLNLKRPGGEALDVLRDMRDNRVTTPVVVIAGWEAPADGVSALEGGAARPFDLEDLVARIGTVLRKPGAALGIRLEVANLAFDPSTREVAVSGQPLMVPRRELAALELLMRGVGHVVTKDALESAIYTCGEKMESNAIESHLSRLRKRLREAGAGVSILGVRGVGYMFREAEAA